MSTASLLDAQQKEPLMNGSNREDEDNVDVSADIDPQPNESEDEVPPKNWFEEEDSNWTVVGVAFTCFFVTIAAVLGGGVLAVPVRVGESGFEPFLIETVLIVLSQIFSILFMAELLQRTQALARKQQAEQAAEKRSLLSEGPDIHTMGKLFLHPILRFIFELSVLTVIVSSLIVYTLAGSTAYGQLFGIISYFQYLIAPFVILFSLIVIFLHEYIKHVISILTAVKGALLVLLVIISTSIGAQIGRVASTEWQYTLRPLLVTYVTLSGGINIMPVLYSRLKPTARNINIFRYSVISAVIFCAIVVIAWVYAVLMIVPQRGRQNTDPSLQRALKEGQISTVPLIEVVKRSFPDYTWIGDVVQLFIIVSLTVSFITQGSALKHLLDGFVKSFAEIIANPNSYIHKAHTKVAFLIRHPVIFFQFTLYFVFFLVVYIVAQTNPQKFFVFLESVNATCFTLQCGLFIPVMLIVSRLSKNDIQIPAALPNFLCYAVFIVGPANVLVSIFAVVYNILQSAVPNLPF